MKQTLLVKLAPTSEQHSSLLRTLEVLNAACNAVAVTAFCAWRANKLALRRLVYFDIRLQFALSAQMAIRAISKVSEVYTHGKNVQSAFRPRRAMVYNERICSFPRTDRVSFLTWDRRMEVPFRFGADAGGMLQRTRGQANLVYRHDTFFLAITVDAPEPTPDEPDAFLGVDLGIIQLETTSDGEFLNNSTSSKHAHVKQVRAHSSHFRAKQQKMGREVGQATAQAAQWTRETLQGGRQPLSLEGARWHINNVSSG